jgi:hypothetical protein
MDERKARYEGVVDKVCEPLDADTGAAMHGHVDVIFGDRWEECRDTLAMETRLADYPPELLRIVVSMDMFAEFAVFLDTWRGWVHKYPPVLVLRPEGAMETIGGMKDRPNCYVTSSFDVAVRFARFDEIELLFDEADDTAASDVVLDV